MLGPMHTSTQEVPPVPPPPRFAVDTDLDADETDVELEDDDDDQGDDNDPTSDDTILEQIEIVGEGYRSLAHFFTSQLEDFVDPSIEWILTCLDIREVQRRFEANGRYRYAFENGTIFRASAKAIPKPTPGEDAPGPAMPTRGV